MLPGHNHFQLIGCKWTLYGLSGCTSKGSLFLPLPLPVPFPCFLPLITRAFCKERLKHGTQIFSLEYHRSLPNIIVSSSYPPGWIPKNRFVSSPTRVVGLSSPIISLFPSPLTERHQKPTREVNTLRELPQSPREGKLLWILRVDTPSPLLPCQSSVCLCPERT